MKPYIIEEAYEVVDAINSNNKAEIMEELGDLLLQVIFLSEVYEERSEFSIEDVINSINQKLIRRHPHVFDENFSLKEGECLEDVILKNWEKIKGEEKKEKLKNMPDMPKNPSVYVSETMPSLHRAYMVQEKAKRIGFDFKNEDAALDKVYEEISEFKKELNNKTDKDKIIEEYGDILFSVVNLGRLLDIHPCSALNKSSDKFIKRFGYMEKKASIPVSKLDAQSLDILWEEAKKAL
ncbi:MAG: nucleoside triphosphate pyrophosphohydrolase [bacterium]